MSDTGSEDASMGAMKLTGDLLFFYFSTNVLYVNYSSYSSHVHVFLRCFALTVVHQEPETTPLQVLIIFHELNHGYNDV
jgi:hypothetical protein